MQGMKRASIPAVALAVALLALALGLSACGEKSEDTTGAGNLILGATVATALYAAFGVGFGALVRNQVGAIVGSLVYLLVIEGLLTIIPTSRLRRSGILHTFRGRPVTDSMAGHRPAEGSSRAGGVPMWATTCSTLISHSRK